MKKKIVFLDAGSMGGDLQWPDFGSLGEVVLYDDTAADKLAGRLADAEIVMTNKVALSGEAIKAAPKLRFIGVLATGFNVVDGDAAKERGIPVCNIPAYASNSVVQHTFSLLLALTSDICALSASVREGAWGDSPYFSFWHKPIRELYGKTFGVVGFGEIGKKSAFLAHCMGMKVLAHTPGEKPLPGYEPFAFCSLEELFGQSDVISLHCPLTRENTGMVNKRLLASAKPGAVLINTARGGLVVDQDLADALEEGRLAGAALDVVGREPMPDDNPLRTAPNCIITPHVSWSTVEARTRLMQIAFDNVKAFLDDAPINICNGVKAV